jgi:hypothetical protein
VDALRAELGQPPLLGLQATLEEKSQQYAIHCLRPHPSRGGVIDFADGDTVSPPDPAYQISAGASSWRGPEREACNRRDGR